MYSTNSQAQKGEKSASSTPVTQNKTQKKTLA